MKSLTLALLGLAACEKAAPPLPPAPPPRTLTLADMDRFLYLSVLEGLMEDGADYELMKKVAGLEGSLFVGKCPICTPVHAAISAYEHTPQYEAPHFPAEIAAGLQTAEVKSRRAALQKLVDRYIAAGFARRAMTDGEKAQMRDLLDKGKKIGMECAKALSFNDACPSCEGANRKP